MADDPSEEHIKLFTVCREQYGAGWPLEAESVMARLGRGLGLRHQLSF